MALYEEINVWRRIPERSLLVRYRCFRLLSNSLYGVQSADFFKEKTATGRFLESHQQFCELLLEEAPESRCLLASTLEEAIELHDKEFIFQ